MENTFSRACFRYLLVQFQRADSFSPTKNVLPFSSFARGNRSLFLQNSGRVLVVWATQAFRKKTEAKKIAKKRKRLVKRQTCLFTLLVTRLSLILHFKLNVFFFFNFFRTETYPLHFCVSRVFKY